MRRIRFFLIIVFVVFSVNTSNLISALADENKSPAMVVASFQDGLMSVMKVSKTLNNQQSYHNLEPISDAAFHFPLMTQIAVGPYWGSTNQELRLRVIKSFRRLSISTLATLFDGYNGEFFEYKENIIGPYQTTIIVTNLVKANKTRIEISYVTRKFTNGWRIIDVILGGGISELKVRKSEYRQILKMEGIYGLIGLLDNKANELIMATMAK
jgi:phospholipid transport system substrate-binding protein